MADEPEDLDVRLDSPEEFGDFESSITVNKAKDIELKDKYEVPQEDVFESSAQYIDDFASVCQSEGLGY